MILALCPDCGGSLDCSSTEECDGCGWLSPELARSLRPFGPGRKAPVTGHRYTLTPKQKTVFELLLAGAFIRRGSGPRYLVMRGTVKLSTLCVTTFKKFAPYLHQEGETWRLSRRLLRQAPRRSYWSKVLDRPNTKRPR